MTENGESWGTESHPVGGEGVTGVLTCGCSLAERLGPPSFIEQLCGLRGSLWARVRGTAGGHRWKQVEAVVTSGDEVVILGLRVAVGSGGFSPLSDQGSKREEAGSPSL